jgi:hypothetical protein
MDNNPILLNDIFGDSTGQDPNLNSNQTQDFTMQTEEYIYGYNGSNPEGQRIHTIDIIKTVVSQTWTSATSFTTLTTVTVTSYTYLVSSNVSPDDSRVSTPEIDMICDGQTVTTTTSVTEYIESDVLDPNHNTWQTTSTSKPTFSSTPASEINHVAGYRYQMCLQNFCGYYGSDANLFQYNFQGYLPAFFNPRDVTKMQVQMLGAATFMAHLFGNVLEKKKPGHKAIKGIKNIARLGTVVTAIGFVVSGYDYFANNWRDHRGRVSSPSIFQSGFSFGEVRTWSRDVPYYNNSSTRMH